MISFMSIPFPPYEVLQYNSVNSYKAYNYVTPKQVPMIIIVILYIAITRSQHKWYVC